MEPSLVAPVLLPQQFCRWIGGHQTPAPVDVHERVERMTTAASYKSTEITFTGAPVACTNATSAASPPQYSRSADYALEILLAVSNYA